ncbi:MAG: twin-arginine translocase TatA/TatE family subunit [Planctomycetes bacterium]|nr:twin-arginine translocase TatA/TatE family subunit [Planctomycetota bacterium]
MLGFLQNIGMTELIVILVILVFLFGATKIPQIARSLGKSAHEFKKGMREGDEEVKDKKDEDKKEASK